MRRKIFLTLLALLIVCFSALARGRVFNNSHLSAKHMQRKLSTGAMVVTVGSRVTTTKTKKVENHWK